ncbi:complex III assembly factor LYRM7-like [Ptychodera flava]|uniref:complex III assembly factor LYRM7-like n=1 Tax=Ptychodera flava TaxID=63121 RepID=UPI003969F629
MRSKVLACFRSLHRTARNVFRGDQEALAVCRARINNEFQKHRHETDETKIQELLKLGAQVELVLKKTVVQAELNEKGNYKLNITKDTVLMDNITPAMKAAMEKRKDKDR